MRLGKIIFLRSQNKDDPAYFFRMEFLGVQESRAKHFLIPGFRKMYKLVSLQHPPSFLPCPAHHSSILCSLTFPFTPWIAKKIRC